MRAICFTLAAVLVITSTLTNSIGLLLAGAVSALLGLVKWW